MTKGECLCGEVRFEIGALPNLYQCHCSLCRRATGSAANAATFVQRAHFRWVSGQERIRSFQKPGGYRTDFCSVCGSPVPNVLRGTEMFWVPVGLLTDLVASRISAHLHLASAAAWEQESDDCVRLEGGPESLESLKPLL
ncbi:MAG: GFA family protein [Azoarcus sp. PHD]|nr:MAG: GFA family protein [Azoarcus sp. PHD]